MDTNWLKAIEKITKLSTYGEEKETITLIDRGNCLNCRKELMEDLEKFFLEFGEKFNFQFSDDESQVSFVPSLIWKRNIIPGKEAVKILRNLVKNECN
jgi:hypothetical protein